MAYYQDIEPTESYEDQELDPAADHRDKYPSNSHQKELK